jgi:hypothetical protein
MEDWFSQVATIVMLVSTAIGYGIPLISDDGIFRDVPGLTLLQERAGQTAQR